MRVALIDPSFWHRGKILKLKRVGYFPLTLPRLAACFPAGTRIELYYEKCMEIPLDEPFDAVFFTVMGSALVRAEEWSAHFRRRGIPTFVGGFSVTPYVERCQEHFSAPILGDAEDTIPEILRDIQAGTIKNFYRSSNPDIRHLPPPRYDLIPPGVCGDIMPVEASRGCVNVCSFCAVTELYGPVLRRRDPVEVLQEIELARSVVGRRLWYFTDANFTADMAHAKTILRGMIGKGLLWLASVDIRCLQDDEFLSLARQSGCFSLQIGLETISPAELYKVRKGFAGKLDYAELIQKSHRYGVPVVALLMVGFDSDTPASLRATRAFLEKNRVPIAVIHTLNPIPKTPLHDQLAAEGRLLGFDLREADGLHVFFRPRHFTPEGLLDEFWKLNRAIYSLRSIVRRFCRGHVFKNPLAFAVLLITNIMAARVVRQNLPLGMYE